MDNKSLKYKKEIIQSLSFGKTLAAYDISQKIGKSLPLTNKILAEMVNDGLLKEDGFAASTGGRRPVIYSIVRDKVYVVAVAMDQYITKIGLLGLHDFEIQHLEKIELPLFTSKDALSHLTDKINKYLANNFIERERILGVGIGMPGFVNVKKGVNYSYFNEKGKELNLPNALEEKIQLPVYIDNDSSLIALTEHNMGPSRGKENYLVINFGWGIGLGMILDGELFRGHNGFAGEFSHIPLFNNNKLCQCGKRGCLETGASMKVIIEKTKEAIAAGKVTSIKNLSDDLEDDSRQIIDAALSGDQLAVELISETAYDIGRGIAILIHILNPEQIIISGRGARAGSILLAPIYQAIHKYCIPSLASYTQILISNFSDHSEIFGAAALVIENFDKKNLHKFFKSTTHEMKPRTLTEKTKP